jgi:two-component system NtrC family sensor kinase
VMTATRDTLFNQQKSLQFLMLNFDDKQRHQEIEAAKEKYRNQVRTFGLIAALGIFLLIAFILYRNNRQKQMANASLKHQKEELQTALIELKTMQAQLIQSEKMASLGELTAGIAHEIQNPLNFVNNFSELNTELIGETSQAMDEGNQPEAKKLLAGILQNEEKIKFHGQRADAIVKGMLEHSRATTGHKEPTDINALANEYLMLSYQGLRARDKSFNAALNTDFDKSLGKINIIPQDIGRVLLNLYNNAFYVVSEKKKKQSENYEPTVSATTKKIGNKVFISVKDNGNGIPPKVLDKIFQPFFTTKPSGQGTGLGLSLSYDIIKAHGGEIKVETKDGEYAEFIIQLPF